MVELGSGGWGLHSLSDGGWLIGSAVRGSRSMYPSPRGGGRYFIFPLSAGHGGRVQKVSKQNKHNPFQVRRLSRARLQLFTKQALAKLDDFCQIHILVPLYWCLVSNWNFFMSLKVFFVFRFYARTHCHVMQKLTMLQKYELNFPGIFDYFVPASAWIAKQNSDSGYFLHQKMFMRF